MELSPRLFIDGAWREALSDDRIAVVSPSSEDVIGYAADATESEIDLAVASARRAFDEGPWPRMPVGERAAILTTAGAAFSKLDDEIGRLVTSEMGAPLSMSISSVTRVDGTVEFLTDLARSTSLTDFRPDVGPALVVREPVGVVAAITPWNGPVGMAVTKIVPALLSGCTVVFKPAPETPFDAGYLADALSAAGLPPGVLNVVPGGIEAGRSLVRHPGIDKVSFTGSTAAGSEIGGVAGAQFKRMQLELGGARVVHGGGRPEGLAKGWYIEPTVVADVDNSMEIARQEIFGPVAVVIPYDDVDEAVRIANDSDYGLHGASSGVGRDTGREAYESFFELKTINLDARTASLFS
jgi:acyl-CoA reductase-like NAD-dependent aldehyde dehydrogenase